MTDEQLMTLADELERDLKAVNRVRELLVRLGGSSEGANPTVPNES